MATCFLGSIRQLSTCFTSCCTTGLRDGLLEGCCLDDILGRERKKTHVLIKHTHVCGPPPGAGWPRFACETFTCFIHLWLNVRDAVRVSVFVVKEDRRVSRLKPPFGLPDLPNKLNSLAEVHIV